MKGSLQNRHIILLLPSWKSFIYVLYAYNEFFPISLGFCVKCGVEY